MRKRKTKEPQAEGHRIWFRSAWKKTAIAVAAAIRKAGRNSAGERPCMPKRLTRFPSKVRSQSKRDYSSVRGSPPCRRIEGRPRSYGRPMIVTARLRGLPLAESDLSDLIPLHREVPRLGWQLRRTLWHSPMAWRSRAGLHRGAGTLGTRIRDRDGQCRGGPCIHPTLICVSWSPSRRPTTPRRGESWRRSASSTSATSSMTTTATSSIGSFRTEEEAGKPASSSRCLLVRAGPQ